MVKEKYPIVKSSSRMLRITPRKLALVANMIKSMNVQEAKIQLQFSKKRIALDVKKTLDSAIANAENNFGMDIDNLVIDSLTVGKAMNMKRIRCRAKGRANRTSKLFSNLYITLKEDY